MRLIVTVVTVILIATTVGTLGILNERYARRTLTEEVQRRLLVEARSLASSASATLLDDYPELTLQPLINEITSGREELAFAVIVDHEWGIQGHRDSRQLGQKFTLPPGLIENSMQGFLQAQERLYTGGDLIVAVAPSIHDNDQLVGSAVLALHRDYLKSRLAEARKLHLVVVIVMLLVGSALAMLVMSRLLRPIRDLVAGLERIGRGDLESPVLLSQRTELGALAKHINTMADDLKQAQIEMVQKERLTHEMDLAREIQESLLGEKKQRFEDFIILGEQTAATEVGGDFYDVIPLPDGRLGLVVADVAGKGLAGCLATSMLAAFLRAYCGLYSSPVDLLGKLDDELCRVLPLGTFVTMFYAILDPISGKLQYASAGHGPMLVYRAETGASEWCDASGTPLAAVRRANRRPKRTEFGLELRTGDLFLQFTDGVNEAWSISGDEQFGFDRVETIVTRHGSAGGDTVMRELRSAVARWSGGNALSDDETLMVVTREATQSEITRSTSHEPSSEAELQKLLQDARTQGTRLEIPAQLEALVTIRDWISTCEGLRELDRNESGILTTALYEYCANIVEHGHETANDDSIELLWLPGEAVEKDALDSVVCDDKIKSVISVVRGCFLFVDHGKAYDPSVWKPLDFADPVTRRKGRGLGLHIIHSSMWRVIYLPSTSQGNITYMKYNPVKHWHATEVGHV